MYVGAQRENVCKGREKLKARLLPSQHQINIFGPVRSDMNGREPRVLTVVRSNIHGVEIPQIVRKFNLEGNDVRVVMVAMKLPPVPVTQRDECRSLERLPRGVDNVEVQRSCSFCHVTPSVPLSKGLPSLEERTAAKLLQPPFAPQRFEALPRSSVG